MSKNTFFKIIPLTLFFALSALSCSDVPDNIGELDAPTDFASYDLYTQEKRNACWIKYFGEDPTVDVPQKNHEDYEENCGTHRPPPTKEELAWLKAKTRHRMVYVKGGEFIMGDFGPLDKTPPDKVIGYDYIGMSTLDHRIMDPNYPIGKKHEITRRKFAATLDSYYQEYYESAAFGGFNFKVKLDDYSMTSHMVEEQEFNLYAAAKNKVLLNSTNDLLFQNIKAFQQSIHAPALVEWADAQGYCEWVGELIGEPLSLPTEAQWEYAARNRGEPRLFATDNGLYELEKNAVYLDEQIYSASLSSSAEQESGPDGLWEMNKKTIAIFKRMPPNPLGFYNFANHGEWMVDHYQPDFYQPNGYYDNPHGPDQPYYISKGTYDSHEGYSRSIRGYGVGSVNPTYYRRGTPEDFTTAFRCAGKGKIK